MVSLSKKFFNRAPKNKDRRKIALLGFGIVIVLRTLFVAERADDPIAGGQHLSHHLYEEYGSLCLRFPPPALPLPMGVRSSGNKSSRAVLESLGFECAPLIQRWLRSNDPLFPKALVPIALRLRVAPRSVIYDRRKVAILACKDFPNIAAHVVPELVSCLTNVPADRDAILEALAATPCKAESHRYGVLTELTRLKQSTIRLDGSWTKTTVLLEECIFAWDADGSYRFNLNPLGSQHGLDIQISERRSDPERFIPLFVTALSVTNPLIVESRAIALGNYGALASNALPALSKLLENRQSYVRLAASNAITKIRTDPAGSSSRKQEAREN
jgi:hypothetical protein